jgi:hypothetical protein
VRSKTKILALIVGCALAALFAGPAVAQIGSPRMEAPAVDPAPSPSVEPTDGQKDDGNVSEGPGETGNVENDNTDDGTVDDSDDGEVDSNDDGEVDDHDDGDVDDKDDGEVGDHDGEHENNDDDNSGPFPSSK